MRVTILAVGILVLFGSMQAFGADEVSAVVAKITGKAQLQRGTDWVPLSLGQKLAPGDTVSTGFRSELRLQIGPSVVTVKALSRLTLRALTQKGTELETDLYLKVGKVDAEVNKTEAVTSQKFEVASPVATASVRGTAFSFDTVNLRVSRGLVDFRDSQGYRVSVPPGESARAAPPGSHRPLQTNQKLAAEDSIVQVHLGTQGPEAVSAAEATLTFDGTDYSDLLSMMDGSDWSWGPIESHIYVGGIIPVPPPLMTHIILGGIVPSLTTHIILGGITP